MALVVITAVLIIMDVVDVRKVWCSMRESGAEHKATDLLDS